MRRREQEHRQVMMAAWPGMTKGRGEKWWVLQVDGEDSRTSYFMGGKSGAQLWTCEVCNAMFETLGSGRVCGSLQPRPRGCQHMSGTEDCENGQDLEGKVGSQRGDEIQN